VAAGKAFKNDHEVRCLPGEDRKNAEHLQVLIRRHCLKGQISKFTVLADKKKGLQRSPSNFSVQSAQQKVEPRLMGE